MRKRPTKEQFEQKLKHMIRTLKEEIIAGKYEPGTYLPSEKTLVKRFRMGSNSIRMGLDQLVEEGWIEKEPRVGNRVIGIRRAVRLKLSCGDLTERNLAFSRLLQLFQAKHPWIKIEVDMKSGLPGFDRLGEPTGSDIIMLESGQFQQLEELGGVKDLAAQIVNPQLHPFLNPLFSSDGMLYMQPVIFSPVVLCYNRAHFQEAGLPEPNSSWTWDDAVRNAEKLSDGKGRYGLCFHLPSLNRWQVFLLQSGEVLDRQNLHFPDLQTSKMMEAFRCTKAILNNRQAFPQYLFENENDIRRMFWSGKISMTLTTYMGMNGLKDNVMDYDVSSVPYLHEPGTLLLALGAGVSRHSKHPEEAQQFIDFLTSEEAQAYIWQHTLSIPSLATMPLKLEDKMLNYPSRYLLFLDIIPSFRTARDLRLTASELEQIANGLKAYWANMSDEEELSEHILKALTQKSE